MFSERTGLDAVTIAMLDGLHELDALPNRTYVKSTTVVRHVDETRGIPSLYCYDAICMLAAPWLLPIPLIDFHGNLGSLDPNDRPANPRYTEIRLAPAGLLARAAEHGELPRLPIALINGDLAIGGTAPSFDPHRVVAALERARAHDASDAELIDAVGPPAFATGCAVEGDFAALAGGALTRLQLASRAEIERVNGLVNVVLTHLPFGIGPDQIGDMLARRVDTEQADLHRQHPKLHERATLPLKDVRNESISSGTRLVCVLKPDADPELALARVLETWPATIELPVQLSEPLAALVRHFVDDPETQRPALATLL